MKYGREKATRPSNAGVTSMPFKATSNVPRSSEGIRLGQSFWTNSARTPRWRARASAISTSKPTRFPGRWGSSNTYGSPPCWSPPQRRTPAARTRPRLDVVAGRASVAVHAVIVEATSAVHATAIDLARGVRRPSGFKGVRLLVSNGENVPADAQKV